MSGDCDANQFRSSRGLQAEKNAKMSVPQMESLNSKPEGGPRITPQGYKSWEASAQENRYRWNERHTAKRVALLHVGRSLSVARPDRTGALFVGNQECNRFRVSWSLSCRPLRSCLFPAGLHFSSLCCNTHAQPGPVFRYAKWNNSEAWNLASQSPYL
jgi:hypothetical protein